MKIVRVATVVIMTLIGFFLGLLGWVFLKLSVDDIHFSSPSPTEIIPEWLGIPLALIGAAMFGVGGYFAQRRMWVEKHPESKKVDSSDVRRVE